MAEAIYRHADLNVGLMDTGAAGHIPGKTFIEEEAETFRLGPPGIVTATRQAEGQQVATYMVESLDDIDDPAVISHVAEFTALGEMGSAWHSFAQEAPERFDNPVDRRRLFLPRLDTGNPETPPTLDNVLPVTLEKMRHGVGETQLLMGAMMRAPYMVERMRKRVGLSLGNSALHLAVLASPNGLDGYGPEVTDHNAQYFAKMRAQWLKSQSVRFGVAQGVNPSIAQFAPANRDSKLAVTYRNTAPNKTVLDIYDAAVSRPVLGVMQFKRN